MKYKKATLSFVALVSAISFAWFNTSNHPTPEQVTLETNAPAKTGQEVQSPLSASTTPSQLPKSTGFQKANNPQQEDQTLGTKPLSPIDRIRAIQEKTALHEAIIEDHARYSRYPNFNQTISTPEKDPTTERYKVEERTTLDKENNVALTIWSNKKYYLHGDEVQVFAKLENEERQLIPSKFVGQLIYNETLGLQQFEFKDEDRDGIYEFDISIDGEKDAGVYKVLVVNNTNELADALTFTLSKPSAELSGQFRDRLNEKGNLLIEAEVKVSQTNRFYLQASLYSSSNTPIGTSQYSHELAAGRHWVPLEFDGLMIHDAQEEGPFLLKNIALAKVAMPIQLAPLATPEFYTKDYNLEQFRSSQYAANH